jgi:hypothetical protein
VTARFVPAPLSWHENVLQDLSSDVYFSCPVLVVC